MGPNVSTVRRSRGLTAETASRAGELGRHVRQVGQPRALNSVHIATFFAGGAIGSQTGSIVCHAYGWTGVTVLGTLLPILALLYWATEGRASAHTTS